ncbi:Inner membrane transport protein YajR [Candidatus Profftia lariciata]|uniref:MFS transporter n=1 Tax=Candidatus Profftia lariciata TaxID=1987921 RepID=UPI001D01CE5F|nr:MFS transporter [Candidatus Profftia lariciata]UDG81728.1 Inner membrane transport protein YajR [Candidatus Profftia lariciata]
MNDYKITLEEWKAIWSLSVILSIRMFGMFMVLPVLHTYGMSLNGSSETLIGIAIGIYGLTQALFQIPCGLLSDRIGRKPLIIGGLFILAVGSVIAALTNSIWGVIIGRSLQGSGAIASTIMALLSDITSEQNRTKAMAFIGINFGITCAISIVIGPILVQLIGLSGLFWIITLLSICCIIITFIFVPTPKQQVLNRESNMMIDSLHIVLLNSRLLKINFSIMCLHILLISSFIALPPIMEQAGLMRDSQWKIYLITMLIALSCVFPCIMYAEKYRRIKIVLQLCVMLMLVSQIILWFARLKLYGILLGMQLFFISFNIIEALLPSLISKESPTGYKGTAMGIYSTSQFIGVAVGGSIGGLLYAYNGAEIIFASCIILTLFWLILTFTIKEPLYLSSLRIIIPDNIPVNLNLENKLKNLQGVTDVVLVSEEKTVYLKIDPKITNRMKIELYIIKHSTYNKN